MFFEIDVLKKFANFLGKHLRWSLFLIKLQDFYPWRIFEQLQLVIVVRFCGNLLSIKFLKITRKPEKTLKVFSLLKILMRQTQFFPARREIAWRKSLRDLEATVHRC